jgi:hypothetical protein
VFETDPKNPPEEFKDFEREIDHYISVPYQYREKTETYSRRNQKLGVGLRNSYKLLRKYKEHK